MKYYKVKMRSPGSLLRHHDVKKNQVKNIVVLYSRFKFIIQLTVTYDVTAS